MLSLNKTKALVFKTFLNSTGLLHRFKIENSIQNTGVTLTDTQLCKACERINPARVICGSTAAELPNQKVVSGIILGEKKKGYV